MSNTKRQDAARDTSPKVGGYDQVQDVSGAPWPGAERALRGRAITPPPPGPLISSRTAQMINAETGQALDADLVRVAARAAERAALSKQIEESHPSARPMLRHIFGVGLPGRDWAIAGTADVERSGNKAARPGTRTD